MGEPIIYPQINRFVDLLHGQHISSFMVTNAQFPTEIRQLKPVTQMYLSIDAATPESLKVAPRLRFARSADNRTAENRPARLYGLLGALSGVH